MRCVKRKNQNIFFIDKVSDYNQLTCNGLNHFLQILVDQKTKQVDLLKVSLTPNYNQLAFIDFFNKKTKIFYMKNSKEINSIDINYVIDLDFPQLLNLKNKSKLFIPFL
jgi:hypothetical protein